MTTDPLLVCYDGSDDAKLAIRRAAALFGARPAIVLSVWQCAYAAHGYAWPAVTYMADAVPVDAANEKIAEQMATEGATIAAGAGLAATPVVGQATGAIWDVILNHAAEFDAAAIVMGSRGLGGVKSLMLGSVSSAVLHHATRPTLIVRHDAPEALVGAPVVLCYDGSDDAKRAIECAGALFTARRAIVLVAWQHVQSALAYGSPGAVAIPDAEAFDASARNAAEQTAAEGVALAQAAGFAAEAAVVRVSGALWTAMLETSDRRSAVAVVLGSRGLSAIKSLLLGSVSGSVVHHTHRPALVVPHGTVAPSPVPEHGDAEVAGPFIG